MSNWLSSLNTIVIDFDQSHLFFPRIIVTLLMVLGVMIIVLNFRQALQAIQSGRYQFFEKNADFGRLIATLLLMPIYFWGMDQIGDILPNMGLGFLLASIPFVFCMSLLYCHEKSRANTLLIVLNAVLSPLIVWVILYHFFQVSLP